MKEDNTGDDSKINNIHKQLVIFPSIFPPGSITTSVVYDKRRQNQMLKKLIEFQHRRAKLEKVAMQLQETITTAARE